MKAETAEPQKRITLRDILVLQVIIIIYSCSSICAKVASGQETVLRMLMFTALEFLCLAVYALLWQQAIKKFDLSVAYANRAMVLLWSMLWAVLVFHDTITLRNILGVLLVIAGTFVINTEKNDDRKMEKYDDHNSEWNDIHNLQEAAPYRGGKENSNE